MGLHDTQWGQDLLKENSGTEYYDKEYMLATFFFSKMEKRLKLYKN